MLSDDMVVQGNMTIKNPEGSCTALVHKVQQFSLKLFLSKTQFLCNNFSTNF